MTIHPFSTSFGSFSNPQGLAVDQSTGDVYVLDVSAGSISKFGSNLAPKNFSALGGNVLDGVGAGDCAGTPADCDQTPENGFAFDQPDAAQVAVDNSGGLTDGDIYVSDSLHRVVDVFASSGTYLGQLTGTIGGGFGESCGVAVAASGEVYVGDFDNSVVHRFLPSANPPVNTDSGVDISTPNPCEVASGPGGSVLANRWTLEVTKFDALGTAQYTVGGSSIQALTVDPTSGHVYLVDSGQVSEYDASSGVAPSLVSSFGAGQVSNPAGVAVNGASGAIYVADSSSGVVDVFETATLPDVVTGSASNVQDTTATVSGTVDPLGIAATWQFEYGTDTSYGSVAPSTPGDAGSGSGAVPVSTGLSGLEPNTTYHYRLNATNVGGTAHGADETFTTGGPPIMQRERALDVQATRATVGAQLYSGLAATTYRIEYGADASYGHTVPVPAATLDAGPAFVLVHVTVGGLQPETTYHWRLVASNAFGTTNGPDRHFRTTVTLAIGDIPRPPGAIDGRGYELVSQPQKDGNQVNTVVPSADGNSALYDLASGGAPGSTSGSAVLFARRTSAAWASQSALPPRVQMLKSTYYIEAATPDLSQWAAAAKDGLGGTDGSPGLDLVRLGDSGTQVVLHSSPLDFGPAGVSLVTSDDLAHVLAIVPEALDPSHVAGTSDVYDFGTGSPVLVSRMPGTDQAPSCGLEPVGNIMDFPGGSFNTQAEHWASVTGDRAFFSTSGDNCSAPRELYMRDMGAGTSTLISGPPVGADADNGVDRFLQATPDGSQVFFRTATSLAAADDVDGDSNDMDIYRWSSATDQMVCVSCAIPNADVPSSSKTWANAMVSEDGSHVYYLSAAQGADAPGAGDANNPNMYVWHASDQSTHFVSQIDANDNGLTNRPGDGSQVTPDGSVLIFRSSQAGLDAISNASNGGFKQYYRYDDRDQSMTCVSCPPAGHATDDVPRGLLQSPPPVTPRVRAVTDDGSTVFFPTPDALVPEDSNHGPDIYEWHDGTIKLITSGRTQYPPFVQPVPISVSADGRDFFFLDQARLTAQAQDGANKLYDARIGGGFAQTAPTARCEGEQCHGAPTHQPGLPVPGSVSVAGSGNVTSGSSSGSFAVRAVSASQRARLARTGRVTLVVRVSKAGRVAMVARAKLGRRVVIVARASRNARRAGLVRVTLRLSAASRRVLARRGAIRVVVGVSFSKVQSSRSLVLSLKAIGHGR